MDQEETRPSRVLSYFEDLFRIDTIHTDFQQESKCNLP